MAARALYGFIVTLTLVAGIEVGYLLRPADPGPRVLFTEPATCPAPVASVLDPETPPASVTVPPPVRASRPEKRRLGGGTIPNAQALAECARNGEPLCGMPK